MSPARAGNPCHMKAVLSAVVFFSIFFVSSGCKKAAPPHAASPTTQTLPTGTATIRGTVTLFGKPPPMQTIPNQPCHEGAGPLTEESVVTDSSGHLQNVIVYLEDAPSGPPNPSLPPVTLDQVNCRYVPHVLALQIGQPLHITTSDPTLHNVHGSCNDNPPFNFALVA